MPTGAAIKVPNGGDLQQALNVAQPGDVIVLEAGGVYQGPFTLPRKTGDGWIAVVSSRVLELAAGQRVLPSDAPKMAVLEGGHPRCCRRSRALTITGSWAWRCGLRRTRSCSTSWTWAAMRAPPTTSRTT